MTQEYDWTNGQEDITCTECWKGTMVEVEVHIYLKRPSVPTPAPLIITQYFCTKCQTLVDEA